MNEKLINDLVEFGLSEYEAKVYAILVTRGPMTASEISKLTKVPNSKIYDIMKKLKLRTIIEVSSVDGHKKFKAVEPVHAIKKVIEEKQEDVDMMKNKAEEILKNIKEKTVPFEDKGGIWLSEGKKEFLEKASLMIKRAEDYAYGITKEFSRIPDLDDQVAAAVKRGVKVKILGIGDFKDLNAERAKWYSSKNVEIRTTKLGIQPRICLVDNKGVCIRIDNENNSEFIWSDNPAMINLVKSYFDVLWGNAKIYK
jgi:sugar-specific transcriptional regulator TrmB